ncbi:unnamed protein product [Polarella glacialis]|uniref:Uncharacterized protein n=1 Tax=Polarella glacialis TaxID=89957 RepID=A0A813FJM6_POLGL|nr:unnamed protein product [Polarella glacialis]
MDWLTVSETPDAPPPPESFWLARDFSNTMKVTSEKTNACEQACDKRNGQKLLRDVGALGKAQSFTDNAPPVDGEGLKNPMHYYNNANTTPSRMPKFLDKKRPGSNRDSQDNTAGLLN